MINHHRNCRIVFPGAGFRSTLRMFDAGAGIVQLDEPYVQARPEEARRYAVAAIDRALDGFGALLPILGGILSFRGVAWHSSMDEPGQPA